MGLCKSCVRIDTGLAVVRKWMRLWCEGASQVCEGKGGRWRGNDSGCGTRWVVKGEGREDW